MTLSRSVIDHKANCRSTDVDPTDTRLLRMSSLDMEELCEDDKGKVDLPKYRMLVASQKEAAEKVCTGCPYLMECRTLGYLDREQGVWGGMTELERKQWARDLHRDPNSYEALVFSRTMVSQFSYNQKLAWDTGKRAKSPSIDYYLGLTPRQQSLDTCDAM